MDLLLPLVGPFWRAGQVLASTPLGWRGVFFLLLLTGSLSFILLGPSVRTRWARDSVWERVQTTGVWRVGLDPSFPPFEDVDASGRIVGFDVDLARAIATTWGVKVDLVSIGYDGLIDAVRAAKVDAVISALPYDPLLTRDVRFSIPYFDAGWRVVVPRASNVNSLEDLAAARVAVEWGSEGDVWARRLQRTYPEMRLVLLLSPEDVLQALQAGEAEAGIVDGVIARQHAKAVRVVYSLSSEPYVVVMPYRAHRLQAQVNSTLRRLRETGVLGELEARWFDP